MEFAGWGAQMTQAKCGHWRQDGGERSVPAGRRMPRRVGVDDARRLGLGSLGMDATDRCSAVGRRCLTSQTRAAFF